MVVQVHEQVAGLLSHLCCGGVSGDAGQVYPPALDFDDEQDVEAGQGDGLDGEEVTGEQPAGLGAEELCP